MANINKLKMGSSDPDAIMFDTYYLPTANQFTSFGSIVAKDNTNDTPSPNLAQWEVNDDCDVEIISPRKIKIKKFKIDTWILRIKTGVGDTSSNLSKFSTFRIKVEGLSYLNNNVICHTAGSDVPDGFTNAYIGTGGWNVAWYPGQYTSGNYAKGLLIQGCMNYNANANERDRSLHMGRAPWDIGNYSFISDGEVSTKAWYGINARGICIALFGGVQNAASWGDNSNGAYQIYDISDHPLIIDLDVPDISQAVDMSSVECWDVYSGGNDQQIGVALSNGTVIPYDEATEDSYPTMVGVAFKNGDASYIIGLKDVNNMCFFANKTQSDITSIKDQLAIEGLASVAVNDMNGQQNTTLLYPIINAISSGYAVPLARNQSIDFGDETKQGYIWSAGEFYQLFKCGQDTLTKINNLLAKATDATPLNYGSGSNGTMYQTSTLNGLVDDTYINSVWGCPTYSSFGNWGIDGVDCTNGGGFRVRPIYEFDYKPGLIYHKDKTVENCWIKYKLAQMHTVSKCSALEVKDLSGISNKKILPDVIDWQDYMEDYIDNTVYPTKFVQFHISISNTDYWDTIREWFANHNICGLVLKEGKIFQNSNFSGELVLNIDHPRNSDGTSYQFISFSSAFENTSITKLTLNLLNGCRMSSLHNMFIRMKSLQQINWNSNNVTCAAADLSGAFEWDGSLTSLPSNMIEWGSRAQYGITPNGSTNFGYVFEGCGSLTSIPMYGENRTADANTVIASSAQQAFNACSSLTYIGPVIDLRYINPGSGTGGYLLFGSCTNVTDARIKNLNHNTWYLDGTGTGNNNHGNLPLLDLESVQYLFNNLVDLNKKNSSPPRSLSNCFVDWNREVDQNKDNFTVFSSIYFHLASASGTNAPSPCYTNGTFENLVINVSGLTSGLRLEFGSGIIEQSDSSITTNGRHTINKSNSDTQGFKLYNDTNEDISTNVVVSIVNPYDDSTPANDNAELHCPSAWSDKITDEMVQTANTKGWTIYIGGTEKVV